MNGISLLLIPQSTHHTQNIYELLEHGNTGLASDPPSCSGPLHLLFLLLVYAPSGKLQDQLCVIIICTLAYSSTSSPNQLHSTVLLHFHQASIIAVTQLISRV